MHQHENLQFTPHGNNAAIQAHLLPDDKMRKTGFTDFCEGHWYFSRNVWKDDISFNLSIPKDNPSNWEIDILDEDIMQPYDYQYYLTQQNYPKIALSVREKVEEWMSYLADAGVLSGHLYGDYI